MAKVLKGVVKNGVIVLKEGIRLPEGTEVEVLVPEKALPRKGSPQALLQAAGGLTKEEAEELLRIIREADVVDWEP